MQLLSRLFSRAPGGRHCEFSRGGGNLRFSLRSRFRSGTAADGKFFRLCVELQSSDGVSALDCLQLSPSQRKTVPTLPDPKLHPAPNSKKNVRKLQCFSPFGCTVVAIPKSVSSSSNAAKSVLQCSLNIIPATGNTASSNMPHLESIST